MKDLTNYQAIKHSTRNNITLYNEKNQRCELKRRALKTLLKHYVLVIEHDYQGLNSGQLYFTITKRI